MNESEMLAAAHERSQEENKTIMVPVFTGRYWPDGSPMIGQVEVSAEVTDEAAKHLMEGFSLRPGAKSVRGHWI